MFWLEDAEVESSYFEQKNYHPSRIRKWQGGDQGTLIFLNRAMSSLFGDGFLGKPEYSLS